jgi:hypothetical protein
MSRPEALPLRWAVILLAGLLAALLVGALTFAQAPSWPAALLAGLAGAGMTVAALHRLVGP